MRKIILFTVLLVLVGWTAALAKLVDNGDGTVTDTATGLMWQQGSASGRDWESAIAYCEGLDLAGFDDWRLPNVRELESLVDYSRYNPTIDAAAFPDTALTDYWSSTNMADYPTRAWFVNFFNGYGGSNYKSFAYHVRAVRGGQ